MSEERRGACGTDLTLDALLQKQASRYGNREAIVGRQHEPLHYETLTENVDRLVRSLAALGVHRKSRLAIVLPNGSDLAVGLLAGSIAAIAVPLSAQYRPEEYRSYFQLLGVTHLLIAKNGPVAAHQVARQLNLPTIELENDRNYFKLVGHPSGGETPSQFRRPRAEDVAVVLMTSGSTGQPKRVPLTHRNLCVAAQNVANSLNLSTQDRCLVMWEQYHIGGLVDLLLAPMISGGQIFCAGGFDASFFFEALETVRPTWFQGVPTTLRELMREGRLRGAFPSENSSLRFLRSVAAPLPENLMADLEDAFQVPVIQTFGMTEAAPLITTNQLPPGQRKAGSTGTPLGCDVAVMDEAGRRLPIGQTGQIAIRGPNVFSGYENDPETNSDCFRNGWFYTGDKGYFDDDGFLFITGRIKELINRGGEKICPTEVEEAVLRHSAVQQVAAFSVPHPRLGEDVGVAIVTHDGIPVDLAEIRKHVAQHLSEFKVPSRILILDELPRCPIGKVRRRELAELTAPESEFATALPLPVESDPGDDPLDLIEQQLAQLWATHLDLPHVGRGDDFRLLGGDSLSQLRLRMAVESLFAMSFTDKHQDFQITTVREMAKQVRSLGGKISDEHEAKRLQISDVVRDLLGEAEVCSDIADAHPIRIRERLVGSDSMFEFKATREALLNVLTLEELCQVVPHRFDGLSVFCKRLYGIGRKPTSDSEPSTFRQKMAVLRAIRKWRKTLRAERKNANSLGWSRTRISPSVYRYCQVDQPHQGRHLIVAFAGNHMRLMLPTHSILSRLGPDYDLLLLGDRSRRHFEDGIAGVAPGMTELCRWVRRKVSEWGYENVTTFGTSAGGLAAICCGYALECHRVAVVGADAPTTHARLKQLLHGNTLRSHHPMVALGYDEKNQRDQKAAWELFDILPHYEVIRCEAEGAHNALQPALKDGRLASLLNQMLRGHSDRSGHEQALRRNLRRVA